MKIIKSPIVTEKSTALRKHNCFSFLVAYKANKSEIIKTATSFFSAPVVRVNTCIVRSKKKKNGRSLVKNVKKAFVFFDKLSNVHLIS